MKRKVTCFIVLFAIYAIGTKAQTIKTPIEFSNYMTSIVSTLNEKGTAWGNKLVEAANTKNFFELTDVRKDIEKTIADKETELRTIDNVGGSEEFRSSIMSFLIFENELVKVFIPFEKLNKHSTEKHVERLMKKLRSMASKEEAVLTDIRKVQRLYAVKNGFTIQNPTTPVSK